MYTLLQYSVLRYDASGHVDLSAQQGKQCTSLAIGSCYVYYRSYIRSPKKKNDMFKAPFTL